MIEAFATGTPVIASDVGSMKELVVDQKNGLHFRVGDPDDLADKVIRLVDDQSLWGSMCKLARSEFEQRYTAEKNYELLMDIYQQAIAQRESDHGANR
jgi:glycosyltransferase involved in cell wall biosynthesis